MNILAAIAFAVFANGFEGNAPVCQQQWPNGQVNEWSQLFAPWPAFNFRIRAQVPVNGYLSGRFVATNVPGQFGTIVTADFPGDGDGIGLMSISKVPGCFDQAFLGANCLAPASRYVSVGWANGASMFSCSLNPGEEYYWNWTYGNEINTGGAHCPHHPCSADVQNQVQ